MNDKTDSLRKFFADKNFEEFTEVLKFEKTSDKGGVCVVLDTSLNDVRFEISSESYVNGAYMESKGQGVHQLTNQLKQHELVL